MPSGHGSIGQVELARDAVTPSMLFRRGRDPVLAIALALGLVVSGCGSVGRVALRPFYAPARLAPEQAEVRLDVPYRTDADADPSRHRLDLFLPTGSGWPMLAFVHGGSLENGDTAQRVAGYDIYRNIGRFYASRGVGVALVNYRLQPAVTWLDQVDDVATATAWLMERTVSFGGDGRIFLAGHSAGSWLVAHVALDADLQKQHGLGAHSITGVISISGSGFDLTDERTWEMFGHEETWRRRFSVGTDSVGWKERASVVPLVQGDAPPFLLLYSSREWRALARQNRLLCDALESANAECRLHEIHALGHRRMLLAMSHGGHPVAQLVLEEMGVGETLPSR